MVSPQGLIRDDAPVEHSFSHVAAPPGCRQSALPDGGGTMSLIRGGLRRALGSGREGACI